MAPSDMWGWCILSAAVEAMLRVLRLVGRLVIHSVVEATVDQPNAIFITAYRDTLLTGAGNYMELYGAQSGFCFNYRELEPEAFF